MDYASSLFLDSLNNDSDSSAKETTATSSSSSSSDGSFHTSPGREDPAARTDSNTSLHRAASSEAWLSATDVRSPVGDIDDVRSAADSDTETDILETVKPLVGDSSDSREDETYRSDVQIYSTY